MRNKIIFDDAMKAIGGIRKNKGLWLVISTHYSVNWRQFLAPGGINEVDFPRAIVLNNSCAFSKVNTARVRWKYGFQKKTFIKKWLSLDRWLIAWGRTLQEHITAVAMLGLLMFLTNMHASLMPAKGASYCKCGPSLVVLVQPAS